MVVDRKFSVRKFLDSMIGAFLIVFTFSKTLVIDLLLTWPISLISTSA